ncbi:MAG: NAD-binding protein [Oscillatoria sp. PMC 1068.18]|nr:NAD-binding protein [Oscillatoria sp. PMC 1076.18]MEC4987646.1 NAD-binding protein [Oscillatoria sp. PMC 1068.18]
MRVILIGGGKLVYFLAKQFAAKGYHLTIVTRKSETAISLSRKLKATVIVGEGSNPVTLKEAGGYRADALLALTAYDQDNLIACQIAQKKYGVPRTIALVNDPENKDIFEQLGVNVAFSATEIIASLLEQQAGSENIKNLLPVAAGRVNVTEIALEEESPVVGKNLQTINLPAGTLIACILRGEEVIVPRGQSVLKPQDRLILVSQPENYGELVRSLTGDEV